MKHSRLSASKSKQWLECPGSIQLSDNAPPDTGSDYALEGTAAHDLAEQSLLDGKPTASYVGQFYTDDVSGKKVEFTTDMAYNVNLYVEEINSIRLKYPDAICFIERKFDLGWLDQDIAGSNDCMVYIPSLKWLIVLDLKYGQGIIVEPQWNTQAMIYSLGACYDLEAEGHEIETISIGIVQPRAEHLEGPVRYWHTNRKQLFKWAYDVLKPGAALTRTHEPDLKTGSHCKFCKAAGICPAQARDITAATGIDPVTLTLPDMHSLPNDKLVKIMEMSKIISDWSNKVAGVVKYKLESGEMIEGYKLVAGRATRKWISEPHAIQQLSQFIGQDMYETKLKTVPQMEKLLKTRNLDPKMLLNGLWNKYSNTTSIAPESDRRPAINASIHDDFKKIER
jgi:hypothetical protein